MIRPEQLVAPRNDSLEIFPQVVELAKLVGDSEFVPRGLRNRPAAVAAAILYGREVGLEPMLSLASIDVIEGTPSLRGKAALAMILRAGHDVWEDEATEARSDRCMLHGRRAGSDRVTTTNWTLEDARRANLSGKDNWRKYPGQMLYWRALGDLGRRAFPDVLHGFQALAEEMEDGGVWNAGETGPVIDGKVEGAPPGGRAEEAAPRRRTVRRLTAPQDPEPGPPEDAPAAPAEGPQDEPGPPTAATEPGQPQRLTLAQEIAMVCRNAGIERAQLVQALTGKTRARDVTRDEALRILQNARDIASGRARLVEENGNWTVMEVVEEPELGYEEEGPDGAGA